MFNWLLNRLERHGRKLVIHDREGQDPYLTRYYLAWPDGTQRQRKNIPFNVFLHQFHRSDDPYIHDHPWNWSFSIILKGGYWEHLPDKTIWRKPGSIRLMTPGNDKHWVEIPKGQEGKVWTMFFRGRTVKDWGFIENGKWTFWKDFLFNLRRKV